MNPNNITVAAIQLQVDAEASYEARLIQVDTILREIADADQSPDMILLPEIWGCGFFDFDHYHECAEALCGTTFAMLSKWAQRLNCWILGGSIIERSGNGLYNTSLLLNRRGELIASYRKMHLFGYQSQERRLLTAGNAPVVVDTEFGKLGLSTCYDLRFPEQYRKMVDLGATIFCVVSAWPESRLAHWRLFNQVRAVENQCWLVSCNCAGVQGGSYAGHSMLVDPMGQIVSEAGKNACVHWSTMDVSMVEEARKAFPALADRINI